MFRLLKVKRPTSSVCTYAVCHHLLKPPEPIPVFGVSNRYMLRYMFDHWGCLSLKLKLATRAGSLFMFISNRLSAIDKLVSGMGLVSTCTELTHMQLCNAPRLVVTAMPERLCQLWTRTRDLKKKNTSLTSKELFLAKQREVISPLKASALQYKTKPSKAETKTMPDLNSLSKQPLLFLPNTEGKIYHKIFL